jgi:hypothetical protein
MPDLPEKFYENIEVVTTVPTALVDTAGKHNEPAKATNFT